MKKILSTLLVFVAPILIAGAQPMADATLEEQLKYLFPEAASFSEKEGSPPHYKAYGPAVSGQAPELLGLAFWTTELDPLERGYDGPIKMLVGMDTAGILTGIILSLSLLLYRMMRPRVAILGLHSDTTLRDAVLHNLPPLHPKLGAIRFDGALRFVNVSYFEDALLMLERENPEIEYILIQSSGINEIDASGIEMLRNLLERFENSGIKLAFSGLKKQVSDVMDRTGLTDKIGQQNIFATDNMAIDEIFRRLNKQSSVPAGY